MDIIEEFRTSDRNKTALLNDLGEALSIAAELQGKENIRLGVVGDVPKLLAPIVSVVDENEDPLDVISETQDWLRGHPDADGSSVSSPVFVEMSICCMLVLPSNLIYLC
jgi:hypothetical protein